MQASCAIKGDGLYEGLDWLATSIRNVQKQGGHTAIKGLNR